MKFGLTLALILAAAPSLAETAAGVAHLRETSVEARPLSLTVWYPSGAPASARIGGNPVFEGVPAAPEAPFPDGALPLVVVSHGGLRSAADSGAWLSASIARAGFVAVEVNAPRPENAAQALDEIWQRPRDIRRAINLVLADATWGPRIDGRNLSVAGVALGATAALSVAGADLDGARYLRSCVPGSPPEGPDCGWLAAKGANLAETRRDGLAGMARDPRVTSVIAVNPEYPAALGSPPADVRTLRIWLGSRDGASGGDRTGRSVAMPGASVFDAFAVCTAAGPEILMAEDGEAAICGVSAEARETIHHDLSEAVISFLEGDAG